MRFLGLQLTLSLGTSCWLRQPGIRHAGGGPGEAGSCLFGWLVAWLLGACLLAWLVGWLVGCRSGTLVKFEPDWCEGTSSYSKAGSQMAAESHNFCVRLLFICQVLPPTPWEMWSMSGAGAWAVAILLVHASMSLRRLEALRRDAYVLAAVLACFFLATFTGQWTA